MVRPFAILTALAVFTVLAFAAERTYLQSPEAMPLPSGWARKTTDVPQNHRIDLIISLKQKNLDLLEEAFWAVSTPGNPRYGKHMSVEQIADLVAPPIEISARVVFWLKAQGVRNARLMNSRDYITCSVTVSQAEKIFGVKYYNYEHTSGREIVATVGPYSVPKEIGAHLNLVSGLVGIPNLDAKRGPIVAQPEAPASKDITPTIIRARYNISEDLVVTNSNNSHAVAEFQGEYYKPSDLETFFKNYVPYASYEPVAKVIGTNIAADPGLEASLDIEYLTGVAPNATAWFYSYASTNFFNDLLNWTSTLSTAPTAWLHSVSYGTQGDYPDKATVQQLDTNFQKIGLRGISVLIASGDYGSGCKVGASDACGCTLYPSYPGSSPYVTAIGATKFLTGNSGPEGAVSAFLSGGGFFSDDTQPQYQTSAVTGYLGQSGLALPPSCSYSATSRATPDGSALGDVHFQVVINGGVTSVGGTSASTPTFAAVFTLLNDIRLNNGESTLGFLNPFIYQTAAANPTAFFDVTIGNNVEADCCSSNGGFQCTPGWDPVTGVGTPNFQVLSTLV